MWPPGAGHASEKLQEMESPPGPPGQNALKSEPMGKMQRQEVLTNYAHSPSQYFCLTLRSASTCTCIFSLASSSCPQPGFRLGRSRRTRAAAKQGQYEPQHLLWEPSAKTGTVLMAQEKGKRNKHSGDTQVDACGREKETAQCKEAHL